MDKTQEHPDERSPFLTKRLFPADGVVWMVSMPSGVPAETAWPDMGWVEALAPASVEPDELWALVTGGPIPCLEA